MVSILVPVYNAEQRLGSCIESILAQTYADFELILLNDGSTDGSLDICRFYEQKDCRIRVIDQKNAGVSATRNRGLDEARGDFIQFVDSDDAIAPDMVEKLHAALTETGSDVAVCGIVRRFPDHEEYITPEFSGSVRISDLQQAYPGVFDNFILYSPVNKLYRRACIRSRFSPELSLGEDFLFNLDFLRGAERMVFVKENLYYYIVAENSLARRYRPDGIEIAGRLYREGIRFCDAVGLREPAHTQLGQRYLETVFYGLSDLYALSDRSAREKKQLLSSLAADPAFQQVLGSISMPRSKQKLQQKLLHHRCVGVYHLLLTLLAKLR